MIKKVFQFFSDIPTASSLCHILWCRKKIDRKKIQSYKARTKALYTYIRKMSDLISIPHYLHNHFRAAQKYFLDTFTKEYQMLGKREVAIQSSLEDVKNSMCDFDEWIEEIEHFLALDYTVEPYVKINYEKFMDDKIDGDGKCNDTRHYFIMVNNDRWSGITNSDIELGIIQSLNFFYCDFDLLEETVQMRLDKEKRFGK